MGWASGGEIFDPVTRAVLDSGVFDEDALPILTALIKALQEADWDTEDESLEAFPNDQVVVRAFQACGIEPRGQSELVDWIRSEYSVSREKAQSIAVNIHPLIAQAVKESRKGVDSSGVTG